MMMSYTQVTLLLIGSVITCFSYQLIPQAIERLKTAQKQKELVEGFLFTTFIRVCGYDHLIMAGAMFAMVVRPFDPAYMWIVIASNWSVAIVSAIAATVIVRAHK